jgi:NADPH:quinone reductase
MKAWRFHEFGHIRNLKLEEVPVPVPADDEVLIRMEYAGLNPADKFLVMGRYPGASEPPYAVGRDGCGTVVAAGRASAYAIGDRVITPSAPVGINRDGTLAEFVALPDDQIYPLPAWWTPADGAAGTKVFLTCWQALSDAAHLKPGETVVVSGASGGIGLAGLALARAMGARTIALTRGDAKRDRLLALGADHVCDTTDPGLVDRVKALGGGDVILDVVGGAFFARCVDMANPLGRICVIGALGGVECVLDPVQMIFKRLQIHGMQVSLHEAPEMQRGMRELLQVLAPGRVRIPIDRVFPFDHVQEAFEHMRHGPMGKVIIGPIDG